MAPFTLTMPDGTVVGCSGLPCQVILDVGKRGQSLDSGWVQVRIDGVPTDGRSLTLTYAAGGTKDTAHATWAYFDNVNTPPVATVALNASSPRTNDTLTATAAKSDVDNDPVALTFVWKKNGAVTKTTPGSASLTDTYDLSVAGNGDKGDTITVEVTPNDGTDNGAVVSAQAIVVNTPPVATVALNNSAPRTNDILTATATKADVDNDAVTLTFVWKKNGAVTKTTSGSASLTDTYDLSVSGDGDKRDTITVEVTPNDGTDNGAVVSAQATVVNSPPVAKFTFAPSQPVEGGVTQFKDLSYDVDPGDSIVSWQWRIQGANMESQTSTAQNPSFIPPNEGTYTVSLTVTDPDEASTTVVSGQAASDGASVGPLVVGNAPPLVNAMSIEVRTGDDLSLVGRFVDSGWLDSHTAVWVIEGLGVLPASDTVLQEDHRPALGAGIVTGLVRAPDVARALGAALSNTTLPARLAGNLRVTDSSGDYRDDIFVITVLPDSLTSRDPNGALNEAPVLTSDSIYTSYVQSAGDVDLYEVKWPSVSLNDPPLPGGANPADAQLLPAGSEVLVTLKGLPADYDLVLLAQLPSGPSAAPFQMSAFGQTGFNALPFQMSPFQMSPFQMSPFQMSPFQMSPFQMSPFQMSPFQMSPLSQMGFTGLDGANIGGTDISVVELSLGSVLTGNVKVVGFSANRGLAEETLLTRIDAPGTRLFVAVLGANGVHSATPYSLQVESSMPFDTAVLNSSAISDPTLFPMCAGSPLVSPASAGIVPLRQDSAPKTLFVTQRERLRALYALDDVAWDALQAKLTQLAEHPLIQGDIISLPSSIYDTWDRNPCSVDAANGVAAQVQGAIQSYLASHPGIQYVVLVGSDDVIPHRRVPDETVISNERYYLSGAFLKAGSPLFTSVLGGYNLTDDYYVDVQPSSWQGRELYVPDRPIGRLVETPQEIGAAADAFLASNGVLNPSTALVSGYDFFADGAGVIADNLGASLSTGRLINDSWSAADLRCKLLGQASGGLTECGPAPDVIAVNAHFTHYAALSAGGFATDNLRDFLSSDEVARAGSGAALLRRIVFSIGCHAGLNVPDRSAEAADPGLGINPAMDFVQAMAVQRAVYVASTGFGLGDDEGIGGTERLLTIFAKALVQGDAAVGSALVSAKQQYLISLSAMTVYDEKSSIQTTLYGLPMYRVQPSGVAAPAASAQDAVAGPAVAVTVNDGATATTTSHALRQVTTSAGSYFTADGDAQATASRPIQPRIVVSIPSDPARGPVHSILITPGAFADTSGFDPVIARPTNEWEVAVTEPQTCLPSFWPSELATVNSLDTAQGLLQALVVVPGQFRCTSGSAATVTGTQRLYSSLNIELLRSPSADAQPPLVRTIDLRTVDATTVSVTVDATDSSGIARINVLRLSNGAVTTTSLVLIAPLPTTGPFTVNVPGYGTGDALTVQVVDGAGNVATATGKGANLSVIAVNVGPDPTVNENSPVTLTATLPGFSSLTRPVSYIWYFGDGTYVSGTVQTPDGTIVATHTYPDDNPTGTPSDQYTTTLRVTDSAGGIGVAVITVTVEDVVPAVTALAATPPVVEGGFSTVSGSFTDVGLLDTHTVTVDWGDGTVGPATVTESGGSGTFTASHQYLDDNPTGTPSDSYTITVTVTDDDTGAATQSTVVTVGNVAPVVTALAATPPVVEGGFSTVSGSFT
ncbi:MAG: PKD domain-containing protein, partial [Chloroflexota bacterium]|nr:PKD domain-containing protein [Chloroflexota bacterium]